MSIYDISKKKISYALPVLEAPSGPLSKWLSAHTSAPVFPNFNFSFSFRRNFKIESCDEDSDLP